jgi:hypothetical protein
MWKGSLIAVVLILITAVCVMGCSVEDCNLPAAQGSCHQHSQKPDHQQGHECFHRAVSPQQGSVQTPFVDFILFPYVPAPAAPAVEYSIVCEVVGSPPVVDPTLTLRI